MKKPIILISMFLFPVLPLAGTASSTINSPFNDVYYPVNSYLNMLDPSYMPNRGEGDSIDLINEWIGWEPPNSKYVKEQSLADYRDYILPAYIYSLDAQARSINTVNIAEEGNKTIITVSVYWEIETDLGWAKVESNNELAEKLLNAIVSKYENDH